MKFFKITIFSLFLFSAAANAENVSHGDVNVIQFWDHIPGALINLNVMSDVDGCGRSDYYLIPNASPHFKQIYALALAAQVSGKKVQVRTSGCLNGFPNVVNFMMSASK